MRVHDGTFIGQAKISRNSLMEVDGNNDYLSVPDHVDWNQTDRTYMCRLYNRTYSDFSGLMEKGTGGDFQAIMRNFNSNDVQFNINRSTTNSTAITANNAFSINTWHTVAGTYDSSGSGRSSVQIDKTRVTGTDGEGTLEENTLILTIGVDLFDSSARAFDGFFDYAIILDKPLTENEVSSFTDEPWQLFRKSSFIGLPVAAVGGTTPKGPFGMPFHGPFGGPI